MMNIKNAWKSQVVVILDEFERGVRKGRISQTEIAQYVGVTRQTIWRDKDIQLRIEQIRNVQSTTKNMNPKRASHLMRIRSLEFEKVRLENENKLLIQNIIMICRRLVDQGLDPYQFVGECANDISLASSEYMCD